MTNSWLTSALAVGNQILSSAIVIIAFSLFVYLLTHNFRSAVARAVMALLAFVSVVFAADVVIANVVMSAAALPWLRFQWLGIAFVPAAYLHFSEALLHTTGLDSRWRRLAALASYVISGAFFLAAAFTDYVVQDGVHNEWVAHLAPGPFFWLFGVYFVLTTLTGLRNIQLARRRCLTSTTRRRMGYLGYASAAPVLGVFPFLLIATVADTLSPAWIYFISLVGNMGVALMTVVMGYAVAYHGVLTPDRVIKHSLIHYLLRGPLVGIGILSLMLVIPRVERILGLPRDTVLIFTVIVGIVLFQVLINVAKPYIDRLIYRRDRDELTWIQTLDQRLFTTTDLEQLLENVLTTLCDFMRVRTGFVTVMEDGQLRLQVFCGSRARAEHFLSQCSLSEITAKLAERPRSGDKARILRPEDFVLHNSYWLLPLYSQDGKAILGMIGIEAYGSKLDLGARDMEVIMRLAKQAERALDDTRLQREVFDALRRLGPEIEELQRLRGTPYYGRPSPPDVSEAIPFATDELEDLVWKALRHFGGGPNLSRSPLLKLKVVQRLLPASEGVPSKALRAALQQAVERLRPPGERVYTAPEWLSYNILDLRFIKGLTVREVAQRLVISDSDLYRKQRAAIAEVARTLADMERACNKADALGGSAS